MTASTQDEARSMTHDQRGAPSRESGQDKKWLCLGRKYGGWRCYSQCMYAFCDPCGHSCGGEVLARNEVHS